MHIQSTAKYLSVHLKQLSNYKGQRMNMNILELITDNMDQNTNETIYYLNTLKFSLFIIKILQTSLIEYFSGWDDIYFYKIQH